MKPSLIKEPSAFLPIVMSLIALGLVIGHIATFGRIHEADEGTAAHLFQLLMVAQVPFVIYFAIKWLPEEPRHAVEVLALQAAAMAAAFASVFILESRFRY